MYIVMEIQKQNEEQVSTIVNSFTDLNAAENKYHTILAAAAVSTVPLHSSVMFLEDGTEIKHETYQHPLFSEIPASSNGE